MVEQITKSEFLQKYSNYEIFDFITIQIGSEQRVYGRESKGNVYYTVI